MCHHGHCSPGVGITLLQFLKLVKGMKRSSTDDDCGTNEQCAGDLVIVENEGEGARCQDSSVSDSEHIESTNAKHGAITSEQDDKTLSEHDMIKSGDLMLSDEHMYLAQAILQKQFPAIDGWQSTLLAQIDGFIPATNESIQIHLVSGNHWVTSSSLGHEVVVYDSKLRRGKLSSTLTHRSVLYIGH